MGLLYNSLRIVTSLHIIMLKYNILEKLLGSLNIKLLVQNLTGLLFLQPALILKGVTKNVAYIVRRRHWKKLIPAQTLEIRTLVKKWNNMESRETIKNRFYVGTVGEKVKSREMYAGIC